MEVKCIKIESCVSGLLTLGKLYECDSYNSLEDIMILSDDKGNKRWYRSEFFDITPKQLYSLKRAEISL